MHMQSNSSSIAYRMRKPLFWGCLLLWLLAVTPATAQVPRLISYQGSLIDGDFPASDTLNMQFDFFDQATGGTSLWTGERSEVVVNQGRFSVLLGEQTSFPDGLFQTEDVLYLQVSVEGEVLSRLQMTSTPYALRASVTEAVLDNAVTTDAIADGAVTSAKVASNAIASGQVVNDALTGDDIGAGAISSGELANGAVTNSKIQDGAISSNKLGSGSVGTGQLVDGSVTAEKLAAGSPENGDFLKYIGGQLEWSDNLFSDATNQPSSIRWKEDVRTLSDPLQLVEQLRGVRYTWKADGRADIGLIAEEVGKVVPEVVTFEENGVDARTVNYGRLVGVLVESIKQQQREMEQQDEEMDALRARVERLEQLLQQQVQQ
jgi:hypothetical protein